MRRAPLLGQVLVPLRDPPRRGVRVPQLRDLEAGDERPETRSRSRDGATGRGAQADAPFVRYVALHPGRPSAAGVPELPLDDQLTADNGAFELHADESDGTRFYVLARIETAREELWCETIALPPVRLRENGTWVEAATQEPLELVRITVDRSRRCD